MINDPTGVADYVQEILAYMLATTASQERISRYADALADDPYDATALALLAEENRSIAGICSNLRSRPAPQACGSLHEALVLHTASMEHLAELRNELILLVQKGDLTKAGKVASEEADATELLVQANNVLGVRLRDARATLG